MKTIKCITLIVGSVLLSSLTLLSQSIFHDYPDVDSIYYYKWYDNVQDTADIYIKEVVNPDSLIFTHYNRDDISSDLRLYDKAHISYSNNDDQLNKTYYKWNGFEFLIDKYQENDYNAENRLIKNKRYYWDEGINEWKPSDLTTYAVFEFDEPQVTYRFLYDEFSNQSLFSKVVRESIWNVDGLLDTVVFKSYDQDEVLNGVKHYHNSYQDGLLLSQVRYDQDSLEELVPFTKVDYQYFDSFTIITYSYLDGVQWVPNLKYEYLYDDADRLLEIKSQKYVDGTYADESHFIYFYSQVSSSKEEVTKSTDFYFFSEAANHLGLYSKGQVSDDVDILIYDRSGRLHYRTKMQSFQSSINITLPSGVYGINFQHADGKIEYLKVIVN